jgi:hypothetical protein
MWILGLFAAMAIAGALSSPGETSPPEAKKPDPLTPAERSEIAESERQLRRTQDELASARTQLPVARKELASAARREPIVSAVYWVGFILSLVAFLLVGVLLSETPWWIPALAGTVLLGGAYVILGMRWTEVVAQRRSKAEFAVDELERGLKLLTQVEARQEREVGELRARVSQSVEKRRVEAVSAKASIENERRLVRVAREEEQAAQELARKAADERDQAYRALEVHQREITRLQQVAAELAEHPPVESPPALEPRNEATLPAEVRESLNRLPAGVKADVERRTSEVLLLATLGDVKRQILESRRKELNESGMSERDVEDDLPVLARNLEKLDGDLAVERGLVSHGPSR